MRGSILAGAKYLIPNIYISADSERLAGGFSTSTFSNNCNTKIPPPQHQTIFNIHNEFNRGFVWISLFELIFDDEQL